jgi:hypothetical protein
MCTHSAQLSARCTDQQHHTLKSVTDASLCFCRPGGLQYFTPPGRILDDRARTRVRRPERQHASCRGLRPPLLPIFAGPQPTRDGVRPQSLILLSRATGTENTAPGTFPTRSGGSTQRRCHASSMWQLPISRVALTRRPLNI